LPYRIPYAQKKVSAKEKARMTTVMDNNQTLDDIIAGFCDRTTRDFPLTKGHLLVLNARDNTLHGHVDPQEAGFADEREMAVFVAKENKRIAQGDNACICYYPEKNLGIVYFNGPFNMPFVDAASPTSARNACFVLEHELGHMIVPNGMRLGTPSETDKIFGENAADAYAMLRHIQRFGGAKEAIGNLSFNRAHSMLEHGDGGHFTGFTLKEIEKLADIIDFEKIDGEGMALLAWRIAQEHAPQGPVVKSLSKTFGSAMQSMHRGHDIEHTLGKIAEEVIGKEAGYYTTRFANILLTPYLKDEIAYKGAPVKLRGAYWDNVREQLGKAAKRLERDGLLFGIPQKEAPPPQKSAHVLGDKAAALGKALKRLKGIRQ
jgi:hypothetical protein